MDFRPKNSVKNPYETAWLPSKVVFFWILPFMWKGYKKDLDLNDFPNVPKDNESTGLTNSLESNWMKEVKKAREKNKKPRFYKAAIATYWKTYFKVFTFGIINEWILRVALMILLQYTIKSFDDENPESEHKYAYSGAFVATTILYAFVLHLPVFETFKMGMVIRIAACSLVYRKALKLSKSGQDQTGVGQMVNMLSNDVNRFDLFLNFLKYIILSPIQTAIFVYFIQREFGWWATLFGFSYLIFLMPLQYWIGSLATKFRANISAQTDSRGQYMNEIIIAIRVIKMYGWELPFTTLVNYIRKIEVKWLKKRAILTALYVSIYSSASKVMIYLTILGYIAFSDGNLSADKVFFALSIYEHVKLNMVFFIPNAVAFLGEVHVSVNRIERFLLLEERIVSDRFVLNRTPEKSEKAFPSVELTNVESSWTKDRITLEDISLKIDGNLLLIIVGPVGSGKTSLLHALLAELPILKGKCIINGSTSYATQEPWIFQANVRQNILFGAPFDQSRYEEVIRVCALQDDLKQLPYGDNTIVGERGVALSGGQKARVNLARALYQEADIILMDDPLSAVDTRVSRHIFDKCIKKHLRNKMRILVTHQLQYLPQADHIVVLNQGKVMGQGGFEELVNQGIDFVNLMASETDEDTRKESLTPSLIKKEDKPQEEENLDKPEDKDEKVIEGSVSFKHYKEYFKAGKSNLQLLNLVFIFIIAQGLYSFSDWWLSYWTNKEDEHNDESRGIEPSSGFRGWLDRAMRDMFEGAGGLDRTSYFWVYTGIFVAVFIVLKIRGVSFFSYCMRISINIHNRMFSSVVRAPVRFYDDNPSGRIMNRFTKDLGSMDDLLPACFFDFIMIYLQAIGVVAIVASTNYYVLIPSVFLVAICYFIRAFYIRTARNVKRMEAVTKSPIFTQVGSSIQGLTTIRALRKEDVLMEQFDLQQDLHSSCWFLFIATTRWFGIWLDLMICLFLVLSMLSFIFIESEAISSNVGLAFSSILSLGGVFQWGMRQSAETENYMTSVERALEYAKIIPEAPLESETGKKPPKGWPSGGQIEFRNVTMSYGEKNVLKDLNFEIREREKIGIVGRTGAGKSSVIVALFRLTEPEGEIWIDGVKINDIGLHDLRKAISIIPQDPVLFTGTIRYNLDPFDQFPDEEIWRALEEVDLKKAIPALDFGVTEAGGNFSVGQRQLVCLARAVLRRNKIIVMDEATANVDPSTDNFIQRTIRNAFKECSIITIAHRLNSVMDCDRILVLDNGIIKEYDHPHLLLQNENGILSSMVQHTGKASSAFLRRMATESYSKTGKESLYPSIEPLEIEEGDAEEEANNNLNQSDTEL